MAKSRFIKRSNVRSTCRFRNALNQPVDPDAVYCSVRNPNGSENGYEFDGISGIVKSETGVYYLDIDTTGFSGEWRVAWWGTGNNQAAMDGIFRTYSLYDGENVHV